jgi:hypothetical protein
MFSLAWCTFEKPFELGTISFRLRHDHTYYLQILIADVVRSEFSSPNIQKNLEGVVCGFLSSQ